MMVIPQRFDTIQDAPMMSAEEADAALHEEELVIGLTVGNESRAYPINMLTGPDREIINETRRRIRRVSLGEELPPSSPA